MASFRRNSIRNASTDRWDRRAVLLAEGRGELTFSIFCGKTQKPAAPLEFSWEVVGYVPLLPATFSSD